MRNVGIIKFCEKLGPYYSYPCGGVDGFPMNIIDLKYHDDWTCVDI